MLNAIELFPTGKQTSSGWYSYNAPCCVHNGENADRRKRGGLKPRDNGWSYHCFNCGYTASFTIGRQVSFKARRLLSWFGVDSSDIDRLNLESLRQRSLLDAIDQQPKRKITFDFAEKQLPDGCSNPTEQTNEYIINRGIHQVGFPFLSYKRGPRLGIVTPFTYNDTIVGSSIRFLDDRIPKYINDKPQGYVFGIDLQRNNWEHVFVVEGVFDALSIQGVAVLHDDVNDAQAELINNLRRSVTVIPDQDNAGVKLIDRAVELGWAVSIPKWPNNDIKDVNDAVVKYGMTATMIFIMQARNTSKIKIELAKKALVRKLK
jgi:hypothetical protein